MFIRSARIVTQRATQSRSFFASSTDHTNLLSNAIVHRVGDKHGERSYVLIPDGTDVELALKVDKLQLARLFANGNHIFGGKVIQRTLGTHAEVCKPLLQMALEDSKSLGDNAIAISSLDGLTKWVAGGIEGEHDIETLKNLESQDTVSYEACVSIATGIPRPGHSVVGQGTYRDAESGWCQLATEFVNLKRTDCESSLYQQNGGNLVGINHLADTSREGLMAAGGSMARFEFNL